MQNLTIELSTKHEAAAKLSARWEMAAIISAKWEADAKFSAISSDNHWHKDDDTSLETMRRETTAYVGHFRKRVERTPYASDDLQRPIGFVHS